MDSQTILTIIFTAAALIIMGIIRIHLNKKKQQEIALYLSKLSCLACGSKHLYVDTRSMRGILNSGHFNISCFDCGNTWKPSDIE